MKIQIISNNNAIKTNEYEIQYSSFSCPITFDLFDINIIDMQDKKLWIKDVESKQKISCSNDLNSLHRLIENSKKSKIIILFPVNYFFEYYSSNTNKYYQGHYLKDNISNIKTILNDLFYQISYYDFIYENSFTKCGNSSFPSAFCFTNAYDNALTKAEGSNNPTTVKMADNCILTTLLLSAQDCQLKDFLDAIGLTDDKPNYPQWLIDLERFDDKAQNETITKSESKIAELQNVIKDAQDKLQSNLRFKSVLTESGDKLVEVVFNILEEILACDLSGFNDERKEDFLIKLEACTFIGEIKGINSNVKSENVSQLDVHYQSYLEKLNEENIEENVKALLIINPQRSNPIGERDKVHIYQIDLAKRNGSLIIPTISLLEIYEKFLNKQITTEQVIKLFAEQKGLIDLE